MRPVLSAEEMRRCDAAAIADGVPAITLMEAAARGSLVELERVYGILKRKSVLVICGAGNNGGDGFAFARLAAGHGATVTVVAMGDRTKWSPETKKNFGLLKEKKVSVAKDLTTALTAPNDVIVDAMLGTGATLPLREEFRDAVDLINGASGFKLAIDLPTGVSADGGDARGAFRADLTATLGAIKPGMMFGSAREACGEIAIVDLNFPGAILDVERFATRLLQREDVSQRLPRRTPSWHKYRSGKLLTVCGSDSMSGAAALAARGALRAGAGLVIAALPTRVAARNFLPAEVITHPVAETPSGELDDPELVALNDRISWCDVMVVGCGLGRGEATQHTVRRIVERSVRPIVLDADGIAAFNDHHDLIRQATAPVILTPHVAELASLLGLDRNSVETDPISASRAAASTLQALVVLKGGPTVVATPAGIVYVNPTGHPAMATPGAGDVLAGVIGAMIAQGCSPLDAALCGVYVHGVAGSIAAFEIGEIGILASEIADRVPRALSELVVDDGLSFHPLPE